MNQQQGMLYLISLFDTKIEPTARDPWGGASARSAARPGRRRLFSDDRGRRTCRTTRTRA